MALSARQQAALSFHRLPLYPPAQGLKSYFPFLGVTTQAAGESPFIAPSPMESMSNFRMTPTQLYIREGVTAAYTDASNPVCRLIFTYRDTSPKDDILFTSGRDLRYVTSTTTSASIVANMTAASTYRLSQVPFRNHNLIATGDNGLWWYDGSTRTARKCGLTPPALLIVSAAGAGGTPNGYYYYWYTFVNDRGHESSISLPSVGVNSVNQQMSLSNIGTGPAGTSSRNIYRSTGGGASPLFLIAIADNTTTTYVDNIGDNGLGSAAPTDNTVPITGVLHVAASNTRVALLSTDGLTIYFCKVDPVTASPNWEAYPTALSLEIPFSGGYDKAQAICYWNDDLYVFGALNIYRIVGDIGTGVKVEKVLPGEGLLWTYAHCVIPNVGIVYLNQNRHLMLFNNGLTDLGRDFLTTLKTILAADTTNIYIGPSIDYDPYTDSCFIHCATSASGTINKTYCYSFTTKEFTEHDWHYSISHYSALFRNYYGVAALSPLKIGSWADPASTEIFTNLGTYSAATIQWFPYTPVPGYDIDYGWIELIMEAKPIVSTVLPTIKVEYALDGSTQFTAKHMDYSKNFISSSTGAVARSIKIPVHKVGRSITVKLTVAQNSAAQGNGCEIYGVNVYARPLREARDTSNNKQFI